MNNKLIIINNSLFADKGPYARVNIKTKTPHLAVRIVTTDAAAEKCPRAKQSEEILLTDFNPKAFKDVKIPKAVQREVSTVNISGLNKKRLALFAIAALGTLSFQVFLEVLSKLNRGIRDIDVENLDRALSTIITAMAAQYSHLSSSKLLALSAVIPNAILCFVRFFKTPPLEVLQEAAALIFMSYLAFSVYCTCRTAYSLISTSCFTEKKELKETRQKFAPKALGDLQIKEYSVTVWGKRHTSFDIAFKEKDSEKAKFERTLDARDVTLFIPENLITETIEYTRYPDGFNPKNIEGCSTKMVTTTTSQKEVELKGQIEIQKEKNKENEERKAALNIERDRLNSLLDSKLEKKTNKQTANTAVWV